MRIVKERKKYWKHITSSPDKTKRLRSGKGHVLQESEGQEPDGDAVQRDAGRRCYAQQDRGGGGRTAVGMGANRTVGGRVRRDRDARSTSARGSSARPQIASSPDAPPLGRRGRGRDQESEKG